MTQIGPSRRRFSGGAAAFLLLAARPQKAGAADPQAATVEVAPGVFVHRGQHALASAANHGDIANSSFIVGSDAVAVVDTGGSWLAGDALKAAIAVRTSKPVRYIINTHMHPDHVLGNAAFENAGTTFVAHHKMARGLAARADSYMRRAKENLGDGFAGTRIVLPTEGVREPATLDLGRRKLTLTARPTAHTDNDLTIRDEETGTLFLGDLLFAEHIPTLDGSLIGWLKLLDVITKEKASRVVPGHGPVAMTWPEASNDERRYLETLASDVRAEIKAGRTISEAVETAGLSERGKWQVFDEHHARNVTAAFAELEWE